MSSSRGTPRSHALVDAIAKQVANFELKPGARLTEEGLARTHKVSRTPVREALRTLHQMGLVEKAPGGGYAVRVIDLESVSDLMVIWATLEDLAVLLASRHAEVAKFEELLEQVRGEPSGDPVSAERFHSELASLSQNAELTALLETIYLRTQAFRRLDGLNRADEVEADHVRILELLIARDVDSARRLIREHIEKTHQFIEMLIRGGVRSLSFEPAVSSRSN